MKRRNIKSSFNLYHIGECRVEDWKNKFLHEVSYDCYHKIIESLPYRALLQKKLKLKLSESCVSWNKNVVHLEDIGFCQQFGCSVLFMEKQTAKKEIVAYCLICTGLEDASKICDRISKGYQSSEHPSFENSDPWESTTEGDFFDDSLQDSSYYDSMQLFSCSLTDLGYLDDESDDTDNYEMRAQCFSMDDIHSIKTQNTAKYCKQNSKENKSDNSEKSKNYDCCEKSRTIDTKGPVKTIPTNVVKPMIRSGSPNRTTNSQEPTKVKVKKPKGRSSFV